MSDAPVVTARLGLKARLLLAGLYMAADFLLLLLDGFAPRRLNPPRPRRLREGRSRIVPRSDLATH